MEEREGGRGGVKPQSGGTCFGSGGRKGKQQGRSPDDEMIIESEEHFHSQSGTDRTDSRSDMRSCIRGRGRGEGRV